MTDTKRHGYAQVNMHIGQHMDTDSLLRELRAGDPRVSMTGFQGLELAGVDAADARWDQVVFRDCTFEDVDFSRSTFTDVVFQGCRFISCLMEACWLNRVDIRSCSAPGLSLAKGRATGLAIEDSQLRYANFSEMNVKGLRVGATSLSETSWRSVRLSGAAFACCDLSGAEFARTSLSGIDLSTCDIAGIVVSGDFRELRGCVIDASQAADLIGLLGVRVRDD